MLILCLMFFCDATYTVTTAIFTNALVNGKYFRWEHVISSIKMAI